MKCVIIIGAPNSIEDYYQQIGRAGRDGEPADTLLIFISKQIRVAKSFLDKLNVTGCNKKRILKLVREARLSFKMITGHSFKMITGYNFGIELVLIKDKLKRAYFDVKKDKDDRAESIAEAVKGFQILKTMI